MTEPAIPAEDWRVLQSRANGDADVLRALVWAYQDGWRHGKNAAHEQLLAIAMPRPPQEETAK